MKHIEALLQNLGIPGEDVSKIVSVPEAEEDKFDATEYVEKVKNNYHTQFQNDPQFFSDLSLEKLSPEVKKKLESGQYARATNVTKEKIAKALGFTNEEIRDLEKDEYKALDYYIPAILEKWTKNKSGDKELQAQLIEARRKIESYDGYEDKIKTQYETESEKKISGIITNAAILGELSSMNLKIAASDIGKTAIELLQSKYAFERVNDFTVELRQKTNPVMKVLKPNSSESLSLREALEQIAKERNWLVTDDKKPPIKGKYDVKPDGKGALQMLPPHLQDKISKKIASEAQ